MRPGALQISTERHQLLTLGLTEWRRTTRNQGGDLSFKLLRQPAKPPPSGASTRPGLAT